MKHLSTLTALLVCLLLGSSSFAQASLTLNQTFSTLQATELQLQVGNENFQLKSTKGSRIIIETAVRISSSNYNLLEFMKKSGRYELEQQLDADRNVLILSTNRLKNVVVIKGEEISETIHYTIYLPSTIKYAAKQLEG